VNLSTASSTFDGVQYSLWHYVWKLLKMQVVLFISGFRRAKTRRKVTRMILVVLLLGFAAFVFWLSWTMLGLLHAPGVAEYIDPSRLIHSVPAVIVTLAFFSIFMTSFGVLLQALYLSRDMDFLLSSPLPMRAVFIAKLLQAILPNFGLICLLGLPVLFGLGISEGYNFFYFLLVILMLVFLTLAAGGLSGLLVMAVVRIFPARRVAEVLGFIGAVISILLSQSGTFFSRMNMTGSQISSSLDNLAKIDSPWSPLAWVGRAITSIAEGRWLEGILLSVIILGMAGAIFWAALTTAEKLYYSGWASLQGQAQKKKVQKVSAARTVKVSPLARLLPQQVRGLVVKDFLVIRRDLRNLSSFITPIIVGFVLLFSIARGGMGGYEGDSQVFSQFGQYTRIYLNISILLFVGWSTLLNLAMGAFSREGRYFWLLRSAPINASSLLAAKYLVTYIPAVIINCLLVGVMLLIMPVSPVMVVYSLSVILFAIAGMAGINLAFGVIGARLDWQDPRQMNNATTGCVGSLISMAYLVVICALFFAPPLIFTALGLAETTGLWVGLAVGAAASLACAVIPLVLVRKRVDNIGVG
jgi:ABC-2 type transport system permease protein